MMKKTAFQYDYINKVSPFIIQSNDTAVIDILFQII